MGKRSTGTFERNPRDYYPTPKSAVVPLLPHLKLGLRFWEPCAGDGRLVRHLQEEGMVWARAHDVEPKSQWIDKADSLTILVGNIDYIITNPPWDRKILHPMIEHFRHQAPTWLLFDADWMHTKQALKYLEYCNKIVSVGRVSWMENGTSGKDNCCWYNFGANKAETKFYGRAACPEDCVLEIVPRNNY
jgi:hypothetical protein